MATIDGAPAEGASLRVIGMALEQDRCRRPTSVARLRDLTSDLRPLISALFDIVKRVVTVKQVRSSSRWDEIGPGHGYA
jgi:hypothetical protein